MEVWVRKGEGQIGISPSSPEFSLMVYFPASESCIKDCVTNITVNTERVQWDDLMYVCVVE